MDETNRRVLTWMGVVFWALLCVSLDLYTTGVGLSLGARELNPYGNMPFLEYPAALFAASLMYFAHLYAVKHEVKLLSTWTLLLTLAVVSLPLAAAANNVMVIGWLS